MDGIVKYQDVKSDKAIYHISEKLINPFFKIFALSKFLM